MNRKKFKKKTMIKYLIKKFKKIVKRLNLRISGVKYKLFWQEKIEGSKNQLPVFLGGEVPLS